MTKINRNTKTTKKTKNIKDTKKKSMNNEIPQKKWYIRMFEPKVDDIERMNNQILQMAVLVALLFMGLIGYIIYFQVYESNRVVANPYNKRITSYGENVKRGTIYSSNGKELAVTYEDSAGDEIREYPYDNMFAHAVGINSHGKTGLESIYNYQLLTSNANPFAVLFNNLKGVKNPGDNLVTTLDTRIQKAAYHALGNQKGAVVVMEPDTGRILAMVSKPDFDPNDIDHTWQDYIEDNSKTNLLNRATQGTYPPGSTFKVLTTLAYVQEHPEDYEDYLYDCDSTILKNSVKVHCYDGKAHGEMDLERSLAKSCNTSFVNLGCSLNQNDLRDLCETFLFNKKISFDLEVKESSYVISGKSDKSLIPQTVIGQGDTLVTPLHNAMIISAIANDGVMMKPYLADSMEDFTGRTVTTYKPEKLEQVMTKEEAHILQRYLRKVVTDGTASALNVDDFDAAGKTGTAETGSGEDHAWFIGFCGLEDADVCVSVIVEHGGSGSRAAVPIAKAVFESFYNNSLDKE